MRVRAAASAGGSSPAERSTHTPPLSAKVLSPATCTLDDGMDGAALAFCSRLVASLFCTAAAPAVGAAAMPLPSASAACAFACGLSGTCGAAGAGTPGRPPEADCAGSGTKNDV